MAPFYYYFIFRACSCTGRRDESPWAKWRVEGSFCHVGGRQEKRIEEKEREEEEEEEETLGTPATNLSAISWLHFAPKQALRRRS